MASERYRAMVNLSYPAPGSLKAVQTAGGLSKMTEGQRAKVTFKHVKAGGLADSIPETSITWLLKGGMIKSVGAPAKGKK